MYFWGDVDIDGDLFVIMDVLLNYLLVIFFSHCFIPLPFHIPYLFYCSFLLNPPVPVLGLQMAVVITRGYVSVFPSQHRTVHHAQMVPALPEGASLTTLVKSVINGSKS